MGLDDEQQEGIWYLIRATPPMTRSAISARSWPQASATQPTGHCRCPVETRGEGTLQEMPSTAAAAGADIMPRTVPDIRVAVSMMPRWNEILGEGNWAVPPI